jgi:hypothetical protein
LAVFRRFFEVVVEQCVAAGVVWGQERFIDSTDVVATAAIDSLQPRFAVEAHLARLFEDTAEGGDDGSGGESGPTPLPVVRTEEARTILAERAAARHDWIEGMGGPGRVERRRSPHG